MKKDWTKAFQVEIGNNTATIDVASFPNEIFVCIFNREMHKDFIDGFKALGFVVSKTSLGDNRIDFLPIMQGSTSTLTQEIMESIWNKINSELV